MLGGFSEQKVLEYAFENARVAATLLDSSGGILLVNKSAARVVARSREVLVGSNIADIVHPDDIVIAFAALTEILSVGEAGPVDVRVLLPSGGWRWLRCQGNLLPSDPATVLITLDDAGPTRRLEEQLDRTTQDLQREHTELSRRSAALSELASLVTTVHDVSSLVVGVAGLAIRHLAPVVGVALVRDDGTIQLAHLAHREADGESVLRKALATLEGTTFSREGWVGEVLTTGEPAVNFEGPIHPALSEQLEGFRSGFTRLTRAVIPMSTSEGAIGVIVLARDGEGSEFTSADVDLATVLASRTAIAVDTARLEESRRKAEAVIARRAAQQSAIAELGGLALARTRVEHLAGRCRELVESTLAVSHCAVLATGDDPSEVRNLAPVDDLDVLTTAPLEHADLGIVLQGGPLVVPDVAASDQQVAPELLDAGVRCLALVRIESHSGPSGVLWAGSREVASFDSEDVTFLEAMANVMASALDAKHALDELRHNAMHDAHTGLPNRVLVVDRLQLALAQARGRGTQVAVLACDVDRFKVVNDGLGHAAGDEVLRVVAQRLMTQVRPGDTVGRFGGDEFVVVCPDVADLDDVVAIAERLAAAFADPMRVLGTDLVVTASIGISVSSAPEPGDGERSGSDEADGLLRDADAAMYRAKDRGRHRFEMFDDAMRERAEQRVRVESELRRALEQDELVLHYQPVVALDDEAVVGVEALVRWEHPTQGVLSPLSFLGVAAESGILAELGAWVFDAAAHQAAEWERSELIDGWVAVNLAPAQLADPRLLQRIDAAIERSGVTPSRLRVEITEDALIEDAEQAASVLDALRERGLSISVDDFGTGYSSLAYLKRLPVDALKLDGGFVTGISRNDDDKVIAAAVIVMAQALGLRVVAEWVETTEELEILRAMGCDDVQGFLFARPMPAQDLPGWLHGHAGRAST